MLELIDRLRRFHREILHGVHVAEPVGALDGVIKMPLPAVGRHVGERGGDTALCRDRVRAGREDLGDAGRLEALFGHAERGAKASAAGADDDHVKRVVDIGIGFAVNGGRCVRCHDFLPCKTIFSTAKRQSAPRRNEKNVFSIRSETFFHSTWI